MRKNPLIIDVALVRRLVRTQFPEWKDLYIRPVARSGWDNRTFHLGEHMVVRMPSAAAYALQVEKEHLWLPQLASFLPLAIPTPLAMGQPTKEYPWKWSIYRWIEGEAAASAPIDDLSEFATDLAQFLVALHSIDPIEGPAPGAHNFYRGGLLMTYDPEVRKAITVLKGKIDVDAVIKLWERAVITRWTEAPVWIHGDISTGNLLVKEGKLSGVIDFGQLAVGDPACDLTVTWTLFKGESREVFRNLCGLDLDTWERGRAWTLWKALIIAAGFAQPNNRESMQSWRIIDEVLASQ